MTRTCFLCLVYFCTSLTSYDISARISYKTGSFADFIVLVEETLGGVNDKLKVAREALESKGFRLSRPKTEYRDYEFNEVKHEAEVEVKIDALFIPKRDLQVSWVHNSRRCGY